MDEQLIDDVLTQIVYDIENEDLTALQELLRSCPETALRGYLSEAIEE